MSLSASLIAAVGGGAVAPEWADVAGPSAEVAALLSKNAPLMRMMLNAGVRHSAQQVATYEAAGKDAGLQATLAKIGAAVSSSPFLTGAAPTASDAHVAAALYDVFSLLYPLSAVPAALWPVAAWFDRVVSLPAVAAVVVTAGVATGGKQRIGGQVDLRAAPERVGALADASIARNEEYKKSKSHAHAAPAPAPAPAPAAAAAGGAGAAPAVAAAAAQPESNKELPSKTTDERIAMTVAKLDEVGVAHSLVRHAAAGNVEELLAALSAQTGGKCKNLFLKAKKEKAPGDSKLWLVVALHDSKVDLVKLAAVLGYGKVQLRMADAETLLANLGVVQGHVSPFCLMNDAALQVNVALDSKLAGYTSAANPLYFHPLTNEASVGVTYADLNKFIAATGHKAETVDFSA